MLHLEHQINPMQTYINEYVELADGTIINRYNICASPAISYTAYRRTSISSGEYSSFTSVKEYEGFLGDITTARLPAEIDSLPAYSQERLKAVKAWYQEREQAAEVAIRKAFPKDFEEEKQEQLTCEKCSKVLTEDQVVPYRTIDPKSGCDTFLTYCETCYKALVNKIYGF